MERERERKKMTPRVHEDFLPAKGRGKSSTRICNTVLFSSLSLMRRKRREEANEKSQVGNENIGEVQMSMTAKGRKCGEM